MKNYNNDNNSDNNINKDNKMITNHILLQSKNKVELQSGKSPMKYNWEWWKT